MFGIRNGIDQELWDPSIDEHLPLNYGPEDVVQGKAAAKRELRRRGNLADVDVPLVRLALLLLDMYSAVAIHSVLLSAVCPVVSGLQRFGASSWQPGRRGRDADDGALLVCCVTSTLCCCVAVLPAPGACFAAAAASQLAC